MAFIAFGIGKWPTIYRRFIDWNEQVVWSDLFANSIGIDLQEVELDGAIVRAHTCAPQDIGKDTGEKSKAKAALKAALDQKYSPLLDALGNPPGENRNEIIKAEELVENIYNTAVIADKSYDSIKFPDHLKEKNCQDAIPPRRNRKIQYHYNEHVVECFFGKIKDFRQAFSLFDKAKDTFQAFIAFTAAIISLRHSLCQQKLDNS